MRVAVIDDCTTAEEARARSRAARQKHRELMRPPAHVARPVAPPAPTVLLAPAPSAPAEPPAAPVPAPVLDRKAAAGAAQPEETLDPPRFPTVGLIIQAALEHFATTEVELLARRRFPDIVHMRQVAVYAALLMTNRSLLDIARRFGGWDHTTLMYSARAVRSRLDAGDPATTADVHAIRLLVAEHLPGGAARDIAMSVTWLRGRRAPGAASRLRDLRCRDADRAAARARIKGIIAAAEEVCRISIIQHYAAPHAVLARMVAMHLACAESHAISRAISRDRAKLFGRTQKTVLWAKSKTQRLLEAKDAATIEMVEAIGRRLASAPVS